MKMTQIIKKRLHYSIFCAIVQLYNNALGGNYMQKLLNKITFYFLNRAFTQMEQSNDLQNDDKVAEHIEDYYTYFVK